ncbi:TNF receptor-associated factor 6-A-like [Haemaphysalis longicornis]
MAPGHPCTVFGFGSCLDWRRTLFVNAIPASRVCSACGLVPSTAALLPCRHGLCPSCLERCTDGECGQCPLDKQRFESADVAWSSFAQDSLLSRKIRCWNADHGCDAVGAAPEILEHFNHHCQYHVISCPSCAQDVAHKDILSHLDSGLCHAATEESRKAQDRHGNAIVVPAEYIQTFENTLRENSAMSTAVLAKMSEVRVSEQSNASAIKQLQQELKILLRELQGTQALICEERTEMSAALVGIKAKIDAVAGKQATGNGNAGNSLEKLEALIGECKTVGTTSGQALADMKVDFKEKLNNLEAASKAIFLDLRRQSEPFEWIIPDWSKLKQQARDKLLVHLEAEKSSYFRGYCILPGVLIGIAFGGRQVLKMTIRVCKGEYDCLLHWPISQCFCLKVVQSTGQCFNDAIELDTAKLKLPKYERPTTPKNDRVWSDTFFHVSAIEKAGCINEDKLHVRFELKP